MDECTAISVQKNYCWIWIAVDGYRKIFIGYQVGSRGTQTGWKLWERTAKRLKDHGKADTDCWKAYNEFIPNAKHITSKKQIYTVEGYNSRLRDYLARLHRRTKCYT